eukprot:2773404-Rhodomonas_salina.2
MRAGSAHCEQDGRGGGGRERGAGAVTSTHRQRRHVHSNREDNSQSYTQSRTAGLRTMTIALVFCQTFLTTSNAIPSSTLQMRPRLGLERTPGLMRSPSNHPGRIPMMLAGSQNEGMLRLRGGGWFDYSTFGLSDKELKAIASLREKLGTILTDAAQQNPDLDTDDRLIRLLRVHDLNVGKTVPLFKKMLKWRAEVKADKIRDDIVKHFSDRFWDMPCIPHKQKFRRFYFYEPFHALDPKGDLVSIECTGAIRVRRFMRAVSEKDVMIFWTYIMEWNMYKLALLSRKQGSAPPCLPLLSSDPPSLFPSSSLPLLLSSDPPSLFPALSLSLCSLFSFSLSLSPLSPNPKH